MLSSFPDRIAITTPSTPFGDVLQKPVEFIWHQSEDLAGFDAIILPGGFSYGDYLRTGAIARFSPVMRAVAKFARSGGLVLGICNGFQILCEAGLLPGAMMRNTGLRFICRHVHIRVETTATPFTSRRRKPARCCAFPSRTPTATTSATTPRSPNSSATIRSSSATARRTARLDPAANPNGSLDAIAGICNRERNVVGLMPHPERAVESALGSTDGLVVFRSLDRRRSARQPAASELTRGRFRAHCQCSSETEIKVTPQLAAEHGLTPDEYARIQKILGRDPNFTELGIFSVMWSEHCSYKSSRVHLKRLPTRGPQVLQGPGENAGVVDVGDGLAAVFKIESHNHPSYVEPFQGAATGVGGILRDVFTMGARPIAVLDSLRFGITSRRQQRGPSARNHRAQPPPRSMASCAASPFTAIVSACPPSAAKSLSSPATPAIRWSTCWRSASPQKTNFSSRARSGEGNPVIYVGAKTGRDGIHGASLLASAEFTEESQQKRPNVQVGDPFLEKLLLEACLEAMATGAIVAIQDMGAAGLTSSSCEMASRGGVGIEIDLARVPQRETGMTPYEMMLSESQERMLLVAERGREHEVFAVFRKWGLDAVEIGRVTSDGLLRVLHHGRIAAEIPAHALGRTRPRLRAPDGAPPDAASPSEPRVPLAPAGSDLTRKFPPPARRAHHRLEALDLRAVRPHGAHQHARRARRGRCRRRAPQRHAPRARAFHRRQRPLVLARSPRRRHARRRRSRAQRRRRRRASLGRHQLPQFRQSRKARSDVAIQRSHRRHRRSLPRARHSHHRRQRQLLQRHARQIHRSHADPRRPRPARRRLARADHGVSAPKATPSCSSTARGRQRAKPDTVPLDDPLREFSSSEYARTVAGIVGGDCRRPSISPPNRA